MYYFNHFLSFYFKGALLGREMKIFRGENMKEMESERENITTFILLFLFTLKQPLEEIRHTSYIFSLGDQNIWLQ